MEPLLIEVTRAGVVEAWHRVHAVAVQDGRVLLAAGDPGLQTFLRSSAKPLQALPVVRACPWLDDAQVALCCASHLASPEQLAIVRRTLAGAGFGEDDLECGPEPSKLAHNCSGKHSGFLALCRARGWAPAGYRGAAHPVQQAVLAELAAVTGLAPETIPSGVDGCGVPTFAVSLRVAAEAFVRLREREGAERVIGALRAHPELLRGPVAADAKLIGTLDGWVAKGGAEGLFCASSPDGLGLALKVEDGSFRSIELAVAHVLGLLGLPSDGVADTGVSNSLGEPVGDLRVAPS